LEFAKRNVHLNNLQRRIKILPREPAQELIPLDDMGVDTLDFAMTNPPFYESQQELDDCAKKKARPPMSACTGAPVEMVTEGGEVGFTRRMVRESLELKERVQWYTTMLGKLSSVEAVVDMLAEHAVDNYCVAEFVQGTKTRRWAVGWSFRGMRPAEDVCRGMKELPWKKVLPPPAELNILLWGDAVGSSKLGTGLDELMAALDLVSWAWDQEKLSGLGRARENVWGRTYRRKMERAEKSASQMTIDHSQPSPLFASQMSTTEDRVEGSHECAFGFRLSIRVGRDDLTVMCRWVEGHDRTLLESFHGYLRTQVDKLAKSLKGGGAQ
jgi:23S rRNA (adenine1618-N6)-methyltransferase